MNYISRFIDHCKKFSIGYAITEMRCMANRKLMLRRKKPVSLKPQLAKERYLMPFLKDFLADIIEKYQKIQSAPVRDEHAPVWVCWLQGEEQAPELVKNLIGIIRQQAGNHPVTIITSQNYANYVTLPTSYLKKYSDGLITHQQFTDMLRCALLADYGGLWVDATGYITHPIPDEAFNCPVYNVKGISSDFLHNNVVVDAEDWMSYLLGGQRGSVTYAFIRDCLAKYWEHYDTCIDYFLMFYIAKIAREQVPACKQEYEIVPDNNYLCEMLGDRMERGVPYALNEYDRFLTADTWFYKLSWRTHYPLKTKDGRPTLGAVVIENILKD